MAAWPPVVVGRAIELEAPSWGRLSASRIGTTDRDLHPPIVHVIEEEAKQPPRNPRPRNRIRDNTKIRRVGRFLVDHDGSAQGAISQETEGIFWRVERGVFASCPRHHRCVVSSQKLHHVSEEPTRLGEDNEAVNLQRQFRRIDAPDRRTP